jgi:hypothetical protein
MSSLFLWFSFDLELDYVHNTQPQLFFCLFLLVLLFFTTSSFFSFKQFNIQGLCQFFTENLGGISKLPLKSIEDAIAGLTSDTHPATRSAPTLTRL